MVQSTRKSARTPRCAEIIPFPDTPRKRLRVSNDVNKEWHSKAMKYAKSIGYVFANEEHRALIEMLLWTSFEGREVVMKTAVAMRKSMPWVDKK